MLDSYLYLELNLGVMGKITLTKENRNRWFMAKAFNKEPILNKHHIVPRHHGGVDEPHNMTPPITLMEHAEMHLEIHLNGIEGYEGTKGCQKCLRSYQTLKGQDEAYNKLVEFFIGEIDVLEFYRFENNQPNILDETLEITIGDGEEYGDTWDIPQTISYQSGVYENIEFEQPDHDIMKESINDEVTGALETLSERERYVLEMYFGINRYEPMPLWKIGERFDLTRDRVRQIKEKAIQRLRHRSRSTTLRRYFT